MNHLPGFQLSPDGDAFKCSSCGKPYSVDEPEGCEAEMPDVEAGDIPRPSGIASAEPTDAEKLYEDGFADSDDDTPEGF